MSDEFVLIPGSRWLFHRSEPGISQRPSIVCNRIDFTMPGPFPLPALLPALMLLCSNVFMTFAWYGHLKFRGAPLALVIVISWGIAFFEYCLAVPANRIGAAYYSAAQLKTMQEVITLLVFSGFSVFWLKEALTWNHLIGFALIAAGAAFIFRG